MSQQPTRVLAAVGLTAALFLVAAAPSRAAGYGKPMVSPTGSIEVLARAWSWLESLLPASPAPRTIQRKKTSTGTIIVSPPPAPPSTGGQGNMIDPEGRT